MNKEQTCNLVFHSGSFLIKWDVKFSQVAHYLNVYHLTLPRESYDPK